MFFPFSETSELLAYDATQAQDVERVRVVIPVSSSYSLCLFLLCLLPTTCRFCFVLRWQKTSSIWSSTKGRGWSRTMSPTITWECCEFFITVFASAWRVAHYKILKGLMSCCRSHSLCFTSSDGATFASTVCWCLFPPFFPPLVQPFPCWQLQQDPKAWSIYCMSHGRRCAPSHTFCLSDLSGVCRCYVTYFLHWLCCEGHVWLYKACKWFPEQVMEMRGTIR